MKTMTEIVESIKNEKLRAFAVNLQEKLEQARDKIVSRRRKVSGAEKSALTTSVSEFTEKNRGKLPQKVAGLLALTMLTSMLASCDEFGRPGHGQDTSEPTWEETGEQETIEIPKYEHLEIEEFVGEPIDPKECGLRAFDYFDFSGSFVGGSYGKLMEEKFNYYMSDKYVMQEYDFDMCATLALWSYADNNYGRENIELDISYVFNSDWTHKIVSTATDFALVSKAPNGKMYVTGFMDGKLKNDAGLIDSRSISSLREISSNIAYYEMLDYTRKEFFGQLLELEQKGRVYIGSGAVMKDINGNQIPITEIDCKADDFLFMSANNGVLAKAKLTEGISEDHIDKLLESETIIELTEEPTEEERTKKRPERKTEPEWTEPIITPEDDMPNRGEEVTTAPETEAEIEPEADPEFGIEP